MQTLTCFAKEADSLLAARPPSGPGVVSLEEVFAGWSQNGASKSSLSPGFSFLEWILCDPSFSDRLSSSDFMLVRNLLENVAEIVAKLPKPASKAPPESKVVPSKSRESDKGLDSIENAPLLSEIDTVNHVYSNKALVSSDSAKALFNKRKTATEKRSDVVSTRSKGVKKNERKENVDQDPVETQKSDSSRSIERNSKRSKRASSNAVKEPIQIASKKPEKGPTDFSSIIPHGSSVTTFSDPLTPRTTSILAPGVKSITRFDVMDDPRSAMSETRILPFFAGDNSSSFLGKNVETLQFPMTLSFSGFQSQTGDFQFQPVQNPGSLPVGKPSPLKTSFSAFESPASSKTSKEATPPTISQKISKKPGEKKRITPIPEVVIPDGDELESFLDGIHKS
jgi:hypothetical protein